MVDLGDGPVAGRSGAAAASSHVEGGLLRCGGVAAEVDDGADVLTIADHQLEQGVAEQLSCDGDGDGADAENLAVLTGFDRDAVIRG